MQMLNRSKVPRSRTKATVQSFAVLALAGSDGSEQHSSFRILVTHLFGSFFADDLASSGSQSVARTIHLAIALGIPPLLLTGLLVGSYSGLVPWMVLRSDSLRLEDHFIFVSYALVVAGLIALLKWETFFPTLLDVQILGLLPITGQRLFSAKVLAAALFLSAFVFGTNLPGAMALPSIAASPSFFRHLLAHTLATIIAGSFAATAPLALIALFEVVLPASLNRLLLPLLQGLLIALLLITLFLAPAEAHRTQGFLLEHARLMQWQPSYWFLGLYETVQGAGTTAPAFAPLAHIALLATGASFVALVILYPLAYQQKVKRLIGGLSSAQTSRHLLDHTPKTFKSLLSVAEGQRAAMFHFVGQTIFRLPRLRLTVVLSTSVGIALAATHFVMRGSSGAKPIVSAGTEAGVMLFFLVSGIYLALSATPQPGAAWVFPFILGEAGSRITSGTRRWVAAFTLGMAGLFCLAEMLACRSVHQAGTVLREAIVLCVWCGLLNLLFFYPFRTVPFTSLRLRQSSTARLFLLYLFVLCPLSIKELHYVLGRAFTSWSVTAVDVLIGACIYAAFHGWYERFAREPVADEEYSLLNLRL